MKLIEKIGALFMIGFDGTSMTPELEKLLREYHVGGVILFKRNITSKKQLTELISDIKDKAGRKIMIAVDHEGGRVFRLGEPFTQWKPMAEYGRIYEETKSAAHIYDMGCTMARELMEVGFNVNFAPVLDVNTNIKNPVIGDRAFSNDPYSVSDCGIKLIQGLQNTGVIACGKHFPGHGDTSLDSHKDLPIVSATLNRLESIELVPFAAASSAGVKSIMTAHVVYEGIDPHLPATMSKKIVTGILRQQMGYDGVVFTDDLNMNAIALKWSVPKACVMSLEAGCDVCLICRGESLEMSSIEHVVKAAEAGEISHRTIDAAFVRVMRAMQSIG